MDRQSSPQLIESTAGQVATELSRLGVAPDARVTILLGTDDLVPGRRECRLRVIAAGLTDADIDRMIGEERAAINPRFGSGSLSIPASSSMQLLDEAPWRR